jgi:alkanesulfonate monooxygenase SsuD/methylene tetrahydromethanopterin reductase-like flavin-dependent oxidoreductase (luciferase family)
VRLDAGLPQVSLKDVPALARAAEDIGFDGLWTSETQHDPVLPCALIAEHTHHLHCSGGDLNVRTTYLPAASAGCEFRIIMTFEE